MEVRTNLSTGQMEVKHPDLQMWVQAIAPLIVEEGFGVKLIEAQMNVLSQIHAALVANGTDSQNLSAIREAVQSLKDDLETLSGSRIDGILARLTTLVAALSSTSDNAEAIKQILSPSGSINALLDEIASTKLDGISTTIGILTQQQISMSLAIQKSVLTAPAIVNVELANANTQYTYLVPAGTKKLAFKCRGDRARGDAIADIRYGWVQGKVAPTNGSGQAVDSYDVLPLGAEESEACFFGADTTLYLASSTAGVIVAVRRWV